MTGEESVGVGRIWLSIAKDLLDAGEAKTAVDRFQRALEIFQKMQGKAHPLVASTLRGLGYAYLALQQHRRAIPYFERALAIRIPGNGDFAQRSDIRMGLARCLWSSKEDRPRALKLAEEALSELEKGRPSAEETTFIVDWLDKRRH